MSKTRQLVCLYLNHDITGLIMQYFESERRVWFGMAEAGEFESCMDSPLECRNDILWGACNGRFLTLAQWAVNNRAQDMDTGLLHAIRGGDLEMVQWTIANGAKNFDKACETCIYFNEPLLMAYLLSYPLKSLDHHAKQACCFGRTECLELLLRHKSSELCDPAHYAIVTGQLECLKLCVAYGFKNWNAMFLLACRNRQTHILEYLRPHATRCKYCDRSIEEHFQ